MKMKGYKSTAKYGKPAKVPKTYKAAGAKVHNNGSRLNKKYGGRKKGY